MPKAKPKQKPAKQTWQQALKAPFIAARLRVSNLLKRRPHRSFRHTRRRDHRRSLKLPGYWSFTNEVRRTLWRHKRLFGLMALIYAALTAALVGIASQETYAQLTETIGEAGNEVFDGNFGALGEAGLLLVSGVIGGYSGSSGEAQQIYATIILLFTWLTTVWVLRAVLAGRSPRLRDGLYNAGSPVLSTFLVGLVFVVQLLPLALAVMAYSAALTTGILDIGVESMLIWAVILLLGMVSVYWTTSTFIALVVVTLPGMYPMQAIHTAGDLVIGRRLRILWRLLWMLLTISIVWILVVVPMILFDAWLKSVWPAIEWLPIVPIVLLIVSTLSVIWAASYVYLLYRRIVDDDASPA